MQHCVGKPTRNVATIVPKISVIRKIRGGINHNGPYGNPYFGVTAPLEKLL
jgi:hypothetical protein